MNYLERLKRLETRQSATDKTDRSTFVSSVSSLPAHIPTERQRAEPEAELIELVNLIADHHGFSPEDRAEALQIALADAESALECFRALVAQIPGRTADRQA